MAKKHKFPEIIDLLKEEMKSILHPINQGAMAP